MNKLQELLSYSSKRFYSAPCNEWTKEDRADNNAHDKLRREIEAAAAKLKKGDKVQFNFPKQIKDRSEMFGFRLENQLLEGTVHKALYNKKRTRFGEVETIPTIVCATATHTYEVSPDAVVLIP